MYIRFVVPLARRGICDEAGIFHSAYSVAPDHAVPDWLREELARELRWFEWCLDVPERFARTFKRRRPKHGICWFRPEAGEHIARSRYLTWLMTEAGAPAREIRARRLGEVIWQDAHQVVARPLGRPPRAFP